MERIYVGKSFSSYNTEFARYDKYSAVQDEKYGYYREGKVYTTKEKHVRELNCFNNQDLSLDEMLRNDSTIRFDYERYCDNQGEHRQYEMNCNGLKYTGSNEDRFDRIESADAYAIDLNKNGKVDDGEIFSKKIKWQPWVENIKEKFIQPN